MQWWVWLLIALAVIVVIGLIVLLVVKFSQSKEQPAESAFRRAKEEVAKDAQEVGVTLTREQLYNTARTRAARMRAEKAIGEVRARRTVRQVAV